MAIRTQESLEKLFEASRLSSLKRKQKEQLKYKKAQEAIDGEPLVIFVDATHLSEKARNKTLDKLNLENVELFAVNFNLPVDVCITQNDQRTGLAKVPRSVIRRMWCTYEPPKPTGEKYEYTVLDIKVKGD